MNTPRQLRPRAQKLPALALAAMFFGPFLGSASGQGFVPLMESLRRFHGDKVVWSFQDGVLKGRADGNLGPAAGRLLTVERFGNLVLRFETSARSRGASVLVRSAIHPISLLGGYAFRIEGQGGTLTYLDYPNFAKMAEARARGVPYSNAEPLHSWESAGSDSGWVAYEVACLGDRLTLRRDGELVVNYRHAGGPLEGSIGFRLDSSGESEVRSIEVQLLGEGAWDPTPPEGDLKALPTDGWDSVGPPVQRISEDAWATETSELLKEARSMDKFRPLFDGSGAGQWEETASFWNVSEGSIRGESHNNFLVTKADYSDFMLRARVRIRPETGNSGIQVRSRLTDTGMAGYQVDMAVFAMGGTRTPWWGQIYGEELNRGFLYGIDDPEARLALVRHGDWNDVLIICKGSHLIVEINGEVTADLVDYYGDKTGRIGFQLHVGPRMEAEFRDVMIRPL
ncbi:MAG: DUF1080 domain-containing protein [Bryobacterales bacterium]|nr:DUF1080 domain-containing protein [Bryobacterales bacterium]